MKTKILLPLLLLVLMAGCSTTEDLRRVRIMLDDRISEIDRKVSPMEEKVGQRVLVMEDKMAALQRASRDIQNDLDKKNQAISGMRGSMAEASANVTDIRDSQQQILGQVDVLRKDLAAAEARANRRDEEYKKIQEKLNNIANKIDFVYAYLAINAPEAAEKGDKGKEASKSQPDKESTYVAAYELFTDGKYDKAREAFQNFLRQYPDTEYSDNAQFWVGECFYFEKKYENAILEYEKVAKNYPKGDKVPFALLKQGISFLNLGDKASAKIILQRVINDYPNTNQARTAKAKLLSIK